MNNNYFFVDGSALLGDIQRVKRALNLPEASRLDLVQFSQAFTGGALSPWHGNTWRRFVFYFVQRDERLERLVVLPNPRAPGGVNDMRVQYCGKRIPHFAAAQSWLEQNNAPPSVRDCLYRSEKAVDTQICCDALQLAGSGKLDRLFLYTNDYDFSPLCGVLRQLGSNINLFRLWDQSTNADLVSEFDAFHIVPAQMLSTLFISPPEGAPEASEQSA